MQGLKKMVGVGNNTSREVPVPEDDLLENAVVSNTRKGRTRPKQKQAATNSLDLPEGTCLDNTSLTAIISGGLPKPRESRIRRSYIDENDEIPGGVGVSGMLRWFLETF